MKKSKVIGLNAYLTQMRKEVTQYWVTEQTNRLIDYAKEEIRKLGNKINTYNSKNHMDRTGNLLNSLCWGVSYDGNLKDSGFYREAKTQGKGMNGSSVSFLHEFFSNDATEVNGRALAESFIQSYKGSSGKWKVFIAILAPYWGYWESGFTMKSGGGNSGIPRSTRFMQFQVMTHIFDDMRMGLKPSKTTFSVYVPKYSYKNPKYKKKKGYYRIGLQR